LYGVFVGLKAFGDILTLCCSWRENIASVNISLFVSDLKKFRRQVPS
jgi:hypothetical protein